jgi:hypothetical protein
VLASRISALATIHPELSFKFCLSMYKTHPPFAPDLTNLTSFALTLRADHFNIHAIDPTLQTRRKTVMGRVTLRSWPKFLVACYIAVSLGSILLAEPPTPHPHDALVALNLKFDGARGQTGCSQANCHGSATPKDKGPMGNEANTWLEKDKHAQAYQTLTNDKSTKIMSGLGGGKATESALCTSCHALVIPAALQGASFNVKEGVTCAGCHGPSEKWNKPHQEPGGADKLRKQAGYTSLDTHALSYSTASKEHQSLLKTWGLFDTRPILARAEICTSCHLAIDVRLVNAGHPQPIFELAYHGSIEPPHWREPDPKTYFPAKAFAAGQVICLRDAMSQLAQRARDAATPKPLLTDAYHQAMAHLALFRHVAGPKTGAALDGGRTELTAAMTAGDGAKIADAANKLATLAGAAAPAIGMMKPDQGTAALIARIAQDIAILDTGALRGAQQQALSLSSLFGAYVAGKGNVAGSEDIDNAIYDKLIQRVITKDPKPFDLAAYKSNLAEVNKKLLNALGADKSGDTAGRAPDPN